MASGIEENVHVTIAAEDAAVSQASFNKILAAGYHTVGTELIRDYTSMTDVETDFAAFPGIIAMATAHFSQSPHPSPLAIGRLTTARAKVFTATPTAANGQAYAVRVNGTTVTYTGDGSASVQEIVEGLKTLIDALAVSGLTVTEDNTTLTLTGSAGTWFSFAVERPDLWTITETTTATGIGTELSNIATERDDWYGVIVEHQSEAMGNAVAAWAEARTKVYGVSSPNTDITGNGSSDLASDAKTANYNRTYVRYHNEASEQFPELGMMASRFPQQPGSETWAFKRVAAANAQKLTGTQVTNLKNKNSGAIRTKGGLTIIDGSKMASGRYIDLQLGLDWLTARMQERLFSLLANNPSVKYTAEGFALIEGAVRAQCLEAMRVGFLANDDNFSVSILAPESQNPVDRAARIVRGVAFKARFAGAAEEIYINGRVFP